ncbi:MAG: carboxypeptidase-like regulatory domain-containing protein [Bacteroidota bacterium]
MTTTNWIKVIFYTLVLLIGLRLSAQKQYAISGYITDDDTGETLIGATVQLKGTSRGTISNVYGFYSLTLPEGTHTLWISYAGFIKQEVPITLKENLELSVNMKPNAEVLEEVLVTAEREDRNVTDTNLGLTTVTAKSIAAIPAIGEADLIRAIKLLPGVQTTSETSSGFSVRGGSPDQNLILLDEAIVYNPSHLLGFFSTFNNDAIKNVQLYKGNMPVKYGGRLSSVLDVRMKEGNNQQISGNGGISLIAARATVEAPIVKDKGSIILSGRRTYADLMARTVRDGAVDQSKLFFYDLNAKANYTLGKKDRLFVSSYSGLDVLEFDDDLDISFKWGNNTVTTRWNHVFSPRLFANTSFIYSKYKYQLGAGDNDFRFTWASTLQDYTAKMDFDYFLNTKNNITFGVSSIYHQIDPGTVSVTQTGLPEETLKISQANSLEHAIYMGNEQKISDKLSLNYGLRGALFQNIGPGVEYRYDQSFVRTDSINRKSGDVYNSYFRFDPRFAATYQLNDVSSVKGSFVRVHQFLQLASNSVGGTPLDVWFQSSPTVRPQVSDQVSVGYFRNLFGHKIETSLEAYYRWIDNQIDFKDHAALLLNEELENELRVGTAWAYGLELLIRKPTGRFNGWASFTWSAAKRRIPLVNEGRTYRSSYERPINVSLVGSYKIDERLSFNATWVYYSGLPFTTPTGRLNYGNLIIPSYTERNGSRMPNYHRMDIGVTLQQKKNSTSRLKGEWVFSLYNAYGRKNPNIITFGMDEDTNNRQTQAVQYVIFRWVPTIAYNFRF